MSYQSILANSLDEFRIYVAWLRSGADHEHESFADWRSCERCHSKERVA